MDGLHDYLRERKAENQQILSFKNAVTEAEYDSDALMDDVFKNHARNSNVAQIIRNRNHYEAIQDYIYHIKCVLIHF